MSRRYTMTILGIDPGIARVGWGVVETQNSKLKAQSYGCFETSAKQNIPDRLLAIHTHIHKIIGEYKPDALSIEELFFNTNVKTAFIVGQARGVIMLAAAENNIPVSIYTPLQVKVAITGYGRAEKTQIGKMIRILLKLKEIPKPDDTTDALAVALTHAFSKKY